LQNFLEKNKARCPIRDHKTLGRGDFTAGSVLPLLVVLFVSIKGMEHWLQGFTTTFLIILGAMAAKTGGSNVLKGIIRITVRGKIAMGISAFVGSIWSKYLIFKIQ
jgi:VIT1/CCC1 family predicted Fe2+/Mn2+ transporter